MTPLKLKTGRKGLLSSLLPVSWAKSICFALPVQLVGRRQCDDIRLLLNQQPIAKSFNSIQTFKVLAIMVMVLSMNCYVLILGIYFHNKY